MLLKRLELTGFKSFATKTSVEFLPGITIIVGPNGCGKSNIFDAVRWVLGEQSAKSLRGTRMNDVIFAGSASYKGLSYSQVSLVIDNQDRKIPVDFSEISVTRRLFASGESEYLLNKIPCRLKDIVELFMDTGIGTDAYSFMEQGRVDLIMRAKPRERRYLFEEAAGISKYKARKEEALRKLIRTEEDLLRIRDIIEEVARNAESLKRQAAKAERYKRLLSQHRDIEKRLLILRYEFIRENFSLIEEEYNRVSGRHAELSAQIATLNAQNEEGRTESDNLSHQLSETQTLSFNNNSEIEKTRHHISLLKERIINIDETTLKLEDGLRGERERIGALEGSLRKTESEFRESQDALNNIERDYNEKKTVFDDLKQSHQDHLNRLEADRREQSKCFAEKTSLLNEIRYSEAMRERISAQISEDKSALETEQTLLADLSERLKEKNLRFTECEQEIEKLREIQCIQAESLQKAEDDLESTRSQNETTTKDLHETQSRLSVIQEMMQNYEGFQQGVKAVMKAAENGEVEGITGMTAATLTLPKEYEQAIESALGLNLQTIITAACDQAEKAIVYLRNKNAGQAMFIPRDLAFYENTNGHMNPILEEQGVIGLARNLINTNEDNELLLFALLGDTVVVDDLSTAMRLTRNGKRARYVTLNGECVETNGVVSGGTIRKTSILSRERVARELSSKISNLKTECQELLNRILKTRGDIETHRDKHGSLVREIHEKDLNRANLLNELETAQQEYKDKKASLEIIRQRLCGIEEELNKFTETIETDTATVQALTKQIEDLETIIGNLIAAIDADKSQVARYDELVSSLLLEQTKQKERCHAFQERLNILTKNHEDALFSIRAKEEEQANLAARKTEVIEAIRDSESKLQSLLGKKEEIDHEVTLRTQEHETLILNLKKLGQELSVLQREFNEVQNSRHEIDLKRAQFAAQKENLSQQSEEKFNKPIDDIIAEMGVVEGDKDALLDQLNEIQEKIDRIGPINATAIDQYQEALQRYEFLNTQQKDLTDAKESLQKTIAHIDQTTTRIFNESFEKIRGYFIDTFRTLFNGGRADLILVEDEENKDIEPGIEIIAQPPGKKLQNISLLSGGEKALTAISLLFSIFMYKPSPFCLMDEIDAPLDDVNIGRFKNLIQHFAVNTQFIIVTHNKQTMSLGNMIYGVTMEEPGVSKLVSVKFENLEETRLVG
jgi:chromosome segregation protein